MPINRLSTTCLRDLAKLGLLRKILREERLLELVDENRLPENLSDQALQQFKHKLELSNPDQEARFLDQNLLNQNDLRLLAEREFVIAKLIQENFHQNAEARYLQRKDSLDQVVYSLIRVSDKGLARELHLQISEAEADFSKLARLHSEGPEKLTQGIVGPAPLSQGHPQLVTRLRAATPGELLQPFAIESWWVIVRLEERLEASFDAANAERMANELFEEWLEQSLNERINSLTHQATQSP